MGSGHAGGPGPSHPPRQSFFCYAVVDVSTTPPTPIDIRMLRAEARKLITWSPDAANLRIRRAKITTLYNK